MLLNLKKYNHQIQMKQFILADFQNICNCKYIFFWFFFCVLLYHAFNLFCFQINKYIFFKEYIFYFFSKIKKFLLKITFWFFQLFQADKVHCVTNFLFATELYQRLFFAVFLLFLSFFLMYCRLKTNEVKKKIEQGNNIKIYTK